MRKRDGDCGQADMTECDSRPDWMEAVTVRGTQRMNANLDVIWLHRSLGICGYLERCRLLAPAERALVTFAIMEAPYGGSGPEELLVTFGVRSSDFLERIGVVLCPKETDRKQVRELKMILRNDLLRMWSSH